MILFSCNSVLRYTEIPIEIIQQEEVFPDFNKTADALEFFRDYEILETVEISASYYGKKFNKKKTASGEIFDMNGISAAHYDYPFGTILRLTNISNNKQIIVKINDRTHKKSKRKIDLSLGAAKELDMIKEGIIKVKAEVLKWGKK
ncbi:MAG TPA: septal ring lytic transglycosylase RlpA family protein [Ignavibacteriaceae bacterium]|jgi:rare lipoprotein A|nr:septal ring lytic transglycosylase RlpA family protein [Ignavibacteriaceae bacterium]